MRNIRMNLFLRGLYAKMKFDSNIKQDRIDVCVGDDKIAETYLVAGPWGAVASCYLRE